MPAACIHLHDYYFFEKAHLKLSPFIQNRVQQDYIPESYARHLPSHQQCHKIVAPTRPLSLNLYGKPLGWRKILPNSKKITHFPDQKNVFNRFKFFTIKNFISSPSNKNFQVIILCSLHLKLQSFLLYHILNFRFSQPSNIYQML